MRNCDRGASCSLLPMRASERAHDVLCVIEVDRDEPGSCFALLLNRPTDEPAQPLAFSLFDFGDEGGVGPRLSRLRSWSSPPTLKRMPTCQTARDGRS